MQYYRIFHDIIIEHSKIAIAINFRLIVQPYTIHVFRCRKINKQLQTIHRNVPDVVSDENILFQTFAKQQFISTIWETKCLAMSSHFHIHKTSTVVTMIESWDVNCVAKKVVRQMLAGSREIPKGECVFPNILYFLKSPRCLVNSGHWFEMTTNLPAQYSSQYYSPLNLSS